LISQPTEPFNFFESQRENQQFLERITTPFDSGKSTGDYKMLLRARQQNASEDIEAYADSLLELAENAYPDGDYRFKE